MTTSGPFSARTVAWRLIAAAVLLLLGACTVVEIHEGDGEVRIERHGGVLRIDAVPQAGLRMLELESVGVYFGPERAVLGYHNAAVALTAPDDCRVIFWPDRAEAVARIRELFDPAEVCVASPRRSGAGVGASADD